MGFYYYQKYFELFLWTDKRKTPPEYNVFYYNIEDSFSC